jgi:hypothetical protein
MICSLEAVECFGVEPSHEEEAHADTDEDQIFHDGG